MRTGIEVLKQVAAFTGVSAKALTVLDLEAIREQVFEDYFKARNKLKRIQGELVDGESKEPKKAKQKPFLKYNEFLDQSASKIKKEFAECIGYNEVLLVDEIKHPQPGKIYLIRKDNSFEFILLGADEKLVKIEIPRSKLMESDFYKDKNAEYLQENLPRFLGLIFNAGIIDFNFQQKVEKFIGLFDFYYKVFDKILKKGNYCDLYLMTGELSVSIRKFKNACSAIIGKGNPEYIKLKKEIEDRENKINEFLLKFIKFSPSVPDQSLSNSCSSQKITDSDAICSYPETKYF